MSDVGNTSAATATTSAPVWFTPPSATQTSTTDTVTKQISHASHFNFGMPFRGDEGDVKPGAGIDSEERAIAQVSQRAQMPKLQGYSVHNIESWFQRVESYFDVVGFNRITNKAVRDKKKFHHLVINIDEKMYEQASDVIQYPPEEDKYETLKRSVLSKFAPSSISRLEQLTTGIQLGDAKPSHVLTQLQRTGVTTDKKIIRDFWLQRLPLQARAVITGLEQGAHGSLELDELATIADEIVASLRVSSSSIAVLQAAPTVSMASAAAQPTATATVSAISSPVETRINQLEKDIDTVKATVTRIESKLGQVNIRGRSTDRRDSRDRSSSRPRRDGSNQSKGSTQHSTCWFHREYGTKARKCNKPAKNE